MPLLHSLSLSLAQASTKASKKQDARQAKGKRDNRYVIKVMSYGYDKGEQPFLEDSGIYDLRVNSVWAYCNVEKYEILCETAQPIAR